MQSTGWRFEYSPINQTLVDRKDRNEKTRLEKRRSMSVGTRYILFRSVCRSCRESLTAKRHLSKVGGDVTKLSVRISTTEERARGFEGARHRLSRNCHAKRGKWWQFANKKGRVKEKMSCQGSSQVTDFASLASALARFGKVGREATNQKVGSSSPPGRTTLIK